MKGNDIVKRTKGLFAILLAVMLVCTFSATSIFAEGEEMVPDAAQEQQLELDVPAEESSEPELVAEEPAVTEEETPVAEESASAEEETPIAEETPADQMQQESPAVVIEEASEEMPLAAPAAAPRLTANFNFMVMDESGEYVKASSVTRTVSEGGTTTNITAAVANNRVSNKTVIVNGDTYTFQNKWTYEDGSNITFPLSMTYDQVAAYAGDGTTAEINLYAVYKKKRPNVRVTVEFKNIRKPTGEIQENTTANTLSDGVGWIINRTTFNSASGLTPGQSFGYMGYTYTYNGDWTDEEGNTVNASTGISFYNTDGESSGNKYYIDEDTTFTYTAVWEKKMNQGLDYHYIDNISTGSGSWSNADAFEYRSQFGSLTHTFKNPEEASPTLTPHYKFQYWQTDEYLQNDERIPGKEGKKYAAGDSFTYTVDSGLPEGTVTEVNVYAYWQPSVTVNWHTPDGALDENAPGEGSQESFDPNEAIKAYSYTPADIQQEVTDEEGNAQTVTFTFDGWYDADGNKVAEEAGYQAPPITKVPVDRYIVDLYPHYTRDITVTKSWDDVDDQDGLRKAVSADLMTGEEVVESAELTEQGDWTYTFEGLDALDEDGLAIEYTVAESQIPDGYEAAVKSSVADGVQTFTITNSHTPEVQDIAVSKVWKDEENKDGSRPSEVTFRLLADGEEVASGKASEESEWKLVFESVPVYKDHGTKIIYSVTEDKVNDYETTYDQKSETEWEVTNSHTPKVEPASGEPSDKPEDTPSNGTAKASTGDPSSLTLPVLLAAAALIMIALLLITRRRTSNDQKQ